jgi:hypothetical protein
MNVSDCRFNGLHGPEVTIVTSAFLPESKTGSSAKRVGSFHRLGTAQMPITSGGGFVHWRVVVTIHEPWAANSEGTILLLLLNLSSYNNNTLLLATGASPRQICD